MIDLINAQASFDLDTGRAARQGEGRPTDFPVIPYILYGRT
jgi:hypothetical protein